MSEATDKLTQWRALPQELRYSAVDQIERIVRQVLIELEGELDAMLKEVGVPYKVVLRSQLIPKTNEDDARLG